MFESYFKDILENASKTNSNYFGITRKDYPKWEGWKIINSHKERGINVSDISDEKLDILVENFHRLKYLGMF